MEETRLYADDGTKDCAGRMSMKNKKKLGLCMALAFVLAGSVPVTSYAGSKNVTEVQEQELPEEKAAEKQEAKLQEWEQQIAEVAEEYVGTSIPGAVVGIADKEQILFLEGYGYGDIAETKSVDAVNSVFEWGSITKTFTWTAVMQLAEEGKIDVSADIRGYLPENYLKLKYDTPITMENLMSHTAGFEDCSLELFGLEPETPVDLEVYLKKNQPKQIYEPGSVIAYSNYSTSLAGLIIERVSGEKWYDYIQKHILTPLNMEDTSPFASLENRSDLRERKVQPMVKMAGQNMPMNWMESIHLYPAGCINGTAPDLLTFGRALLDEESGLFKENRTYEELWTYTMEDGGYITGNMHGFWELPTKELVASHGGGTMGFATELAVAPEEGLVVVVLTNSPLGTEFCTEIMKKVFDFEEFPKAVEEMSDAGNAVGSAAENVGDIEGNYIEARRSDTDFTKLVTALMQVKVKDKGNGEIVVSELGGESVYEQIAPATYQLRESNSMMRGIFFPVIKFVKDGDGSNIMRSGYIQDCVETPVQYSPFVVYLTLFVFALSNMFFPITALVVGGRKVIGKIRKKPFGKGYNRGSGYVLLCGVLLTVNTVIMIIRNYMSFMTFEREAMKIHMGMNAAILSVGMTLSVMTLLRISRSRQWKENAFAVFTAGLFVVLSSFLLFWRFVI